jgi:hypothetical protein
MKILKVDQLIEARGYPGLSKNFRKQGSYEVTAIKDGNTINFKGSTIGDIYKNIIDWLFKNDYTFNGSIHIAKVRKIFSSSGIESESSYSFSDFYEFADDKYLLIRKINTSQIMSNIKLMFNNFGVTDVKFIGFSEEDEFISEVPEIDNIEDGGDFSDLEEIRPFGKFPQPFDVEGELTKAQSQSEEDVLSFKSFRASEPNEKPDDLMVFNLYVKNPFSQAICVLGESGAGKSTTIDNILKNSGHIYQYIIPSASTTGLLSQFSPSAGAAGGYIPSRLGQMIEKAYNNKDVNYTAVFDECHKTSIIEMINDELLQSISKNRNKGVRFISLDDDTRRLYPSAQEDNRGNVLIPDNFGFIFISSNVRVISGNPDFFNRVDLIELTKEDRKLNTIDDLNQKRVIGREDKKELVNQIKSKKDD